MRINNLPRVAIYLRVSSEMQIDNYSLDAQENACQSFASLRGWQVVTVYREQGASAKTLDRPEFQRMLLDAEQGQFDVLLVHKLDRFSRSLSDIINIIPHLDELGVSLVSASEAFDLSTPQGKMMVNMLSVVNQWYLDNLAQEISKGKRQRARSGDWNGTLSYGYTTPQRLKAQREDADDEQRTIIDATLARYSDVHDTGAIPCPFNADGVSFAFSQYATGNFSFRQIADILNEAGYRCNSRDGTGLFSAEMISEMLRNKFYLGQTSYGAKVKGKRREWMAGNHDAIIDATLFERCQAIRAKVASTQKVHNKAKPYPLSGIMYELENGAKWRGRYRANRREYVRDKTDTMPGTSVKADEIENDVLNILQGITIPGDWHKRVMQSLTKQPAKTNDHDALKQRLERMKTLFLLGDISEDEYISERERITRILKPQKVVRVNYEELNQIAETMKSLPSIWQVATLEEREELARLLLHRVYINEKSVAGIEASALLSHFIQSQRTAVRGGQETDTQRGHVLKCRFGRVRFKNIYLAS